MQQDWSAGEDIRQDGKEIGSCIDISPSHRKFSRVLALPMEFFARAGLMPRQKCSPPYLARA